MIRPRLVRFYCCHIFALGPSLNASVVSIDDAFVGLSSDRPRPSGGGATPAMWLKRVIDPGDNVGFDGISIRWGGSAP
jgi:hypothetical protein